MLLSVAVSLSACVLRAVGATDPTLSIGSGPAYPGATASAPIRLTKATNVVAAQFDVSYNPSKVLAGTPVRGSQMGGHILRSREISPGVVRIVEYSLNNARIGQTNITLATVPLTLAPSERTSSGPLTLSNVVLARRDATALSPLSLGSGNLFVNPVFLNPDGTANFFLPSRPDERYLIQATTNFVNWVNLSTNFALGNFMDLVDLDAPIYPYRFYRSALFDALGQLGPVSILPGGRFTFQLIGVSGRSYTIQTSTNLVNWESVTNVIATGGTIQITNTIDPAFSTRFFRLSSQP